MSTVLAISDYHSPFHHRDALAFLVELKKKYRPDETVVLGDEADFHALSNYEADPDGHSAGHELEAAVDGLQGLYRAFPKAKVCISNHTARPFRRAHKFGIPKAFLRPYREFLRAPNDWWWSEKFRIDGVEYEHGEGLAGAAGALKGALARMNSLVIGHLHAHAGCAWAANSRHLVFGLNCGWLGDVSAYSMAYAKHSLSKPVCGSGIIIDGLPSFIPMVLDGHGRWKGDL